MLFSSSLKQLRLSYNLSQTQLAKKLNVSPKTISNW
ncbi:helix-turn-helix transcriptional regulator [Leuconostoc suionicum]|nr:helix-turn-helix transcriptional regulator [Leuconostoc suionicum]MDC2806223.1 helix-turn-helix transcriptional regulator [Leuconostoc suionicum]MDC2823735.1 helix-turn-helix transcriptional regulator [Leuconostoc suionicum]